jgi:hypothetical protein
MQVKRQGNQYVTHADAGTVAALAGVGDARARMASAKATATPDTAFARRDGATKVRGWDMSDPVFSGTA